MHLQVLILTSSMSGKGKISYWQTFSNAGASIQEAFCHLGSVPLESTVTDALEEYICKLYYSVTDIIRVLDALEKKTELKQLPLSRAVFLEGVKRALYQGIIWKSSAVINPNKSMPDNNG